MTSLLHKDAAFCENTMDESSSTEGATLLSVSSPDAPFESKFRPYKMRCLALVAHDHMQPALLDFVQSHRELLKKFCLTGPKDTVDMICSIYEKDDDVPSIIPCLATPGYSAEAHLAVQICLHDIGGVVFFMDPLAAHQQDANAIMTMANRHNVLLLSNPTTATAMSHMIRLALLEGRLELATSFFENCPSPAVKEYKRRHDATTLEDNAVAESMLDATLLMNILSPTKI